VNGVEGIPTALAQEKAIRESLGMCC